MARDIAGVARNSCPLCGELTSVPVLDLLFARAPAAFRCSACNGRIRFASSNRLLAGVGGFLAVGVALGVYFHFFAWRGRAGAHPFADSWRGCFPLLLGLAAYVVGAIPFGRWTLKLEPASG